MNYLQYIRNSKFSFKLNPKDVQFFLQKLNSKNQKVGLEGIEKDNISVYLKREDRIHEKISGNKFRKLKYPILDMLSGDKVGILTFGGAHSNHIAAVAAAGKMCGFRTRGLIRGDELRSEISNNPTLRFVSECNMELDFMSRADYRDKTNSGVLSKYVNDAEQWYIVPEGGTSELAVKGCEEILTEADDEFDYICVAVGTGGTYAGLLNSLKPHQKGIGFSVLKGTFQKEAIDTYTDVRSYTLTDDYCFGGYAKIDSELIRFMNNFKRMNGILLDPVYTAKMMYGIAEMINAGYFKENSRILAIHTGGLQGIEAMNRLLEKKNLPQIEL